MCTHIHIYVIIYFYFKKNIYFFIYKYNYIFFFFPNIYQCAKYHTKDHRENNNAFFRDGLKSHGMN